MYNTMTTTITFGSTFALPASGDDLWFITDRRPSSYRTPEELDIPGRTILATASCGVRFSGYYDRKTGWRGQDMREEFSREEISAQLNAVEMHLDHRTDEEWRALHLAWMREEIAHALTSDRLKFPGGLRQHHPLVSLEEVAAHAAAVAAEVANGGDLPGLYENVYAATLAHLSA